MKKWRRVDRKTSIYALVDPRTGMIRYVGKTTGKLRSRLATHLAQSRDHLKHRRRYWVLHWVHELVRLGLKPEIFELELIEEGEDWSEAECFWIEVVKGWGFDLCNVRLGGQAGNFTKQSAETVEKRVSKLRGRPGRKLTPEQKVRACELLAKGRANRVWTPEQRAQVAKVGRAWALSPKPRGVDNPSSRAVIINLVKYGSVYEATRMIGVTRRTLYNWLRDGVAVYADELLPGPGISPADFYKAKPRRGIEVDGTEEKYPSMHFLARKLGIDVSTVSYRLRRGLPVDAPPKRTGLRNYSE